MLVGCWAQAASRASAKGNNRRGWRAMHLEVEIVNTRAQRSYARFGFQPSPRKLMTKTL